MAKNRPARNKERRLHGAGAAGPEEARAERAENKFEWHGEVARLRHHAGGGPG